MDGLRVANGRPNVLTLAVSEVVGYLDSSYRNNAFID